MALARLLLQSTPGEQCSETLLRLPHPTDIRHCPSLDHSPSFASIRRPYRAGLTSAGLESADQMAACWAGFTSRVAMCVYGVCAFVLLTCFSCSYTVLPKEHSLGVIFFLLTFLMSCCIFLQFYLHFTTDYTRMIVYVTNNKEPWTLNYCSQICLNLC